MGWLLVVTFFCVIGAADPDFTNVTDKVQILPLHWAFRDVQLCDHQIVYAIDVLYRALVSRDGMMNFSPIPDVNLVEGFAKIFVNDHHPEISYFVTRSGNFLTKDKGTTFKFQPTDQAFTNFEFHPIDGSKILAQDLYLANSPLFESDDYGASWKPLPSQNLPSSGTNISKFFWCPIPSPTTPENSHRVCLIASGKFYISNYDDNGFSWHQPVPGTAKFFNTYSRFMTLVTNNNNADIFYTSSDNGVHFHPSLLPRGINIGLLESSQFWEDPDGIMWITIPEGNTQGSTSGSLYVSDSDGDDFALALKSVHSLNNWWDVHIIPYMSGTLIANTVFSTDPLLLKTAMTFNNGQSWEPLEAPVVDANGNPVELCKGCSLHLFGRTTWLGAGGEGYFGDFYSSEDAVGLILGTGNIGPYLDTKKDNVNTYLSRDGGITWFEIFEGSMAYDIGDFGGLLVLARNQILTNEIFFSWDGGASFYVVYLPQALIVNELFTISSKSEQFLIYGRESEQAANHFWYGIDFSALHERDCQPEDFETWNPHNGAKGPNCVLGRNILYQRRKRESKCFTPDGINKVLSVEPCPCQESDYECDTDFEKSEKSGKCLSILPPQNNETATKLLCQGQDTYYVSSGYRKVPGDLCVDELPEKARIPQPCPSSGRKGLYVMLTIGFLFIVVLAISVAYFFREKICPTTPEWGGPGYSNSLVEESGRQDFSDNDMIHLSSSEQLDSSD